MDFIVLDISSSTFISVGVAVICRFSDGDDDARGFKEGVHRTDDLIINPRNTMTMLDMIEEGKGPIALNF